MKEQNNLWLSVIAGGSGTRLFLFSNDNCPKQFCQMDENNTFIQATVKRFLSIGVDPKHVVIIVTNDVQKNLAIEQIVEKLNVLSGNVLEIGPEHGYAGAMIVATRFIQEQDENATIIQTPSDQYVDSGEEFKRAIREAIATVNDGNPAIIGKKITNAETAKELGNIIYTESGRAIVKIDDFIEKPSVETISEIMKVKNSACNTGINIWKPSMLREWSDRNVGTDTLIKEVLIEPKLIIGAFAWGDCGTFKALYQLNHNKTGNPVVTLSNKDNICHENCNKTLMITEDAIELNVCGANEVAIIAREIDNNYYLEIASFDAINEVAMAAKIFKGCPDSFKDGVTIGGINNEFINPYKTKYHICFIGVSGYKVNTYTRKSNKKGFNIAKDV